MIAPVVVCGPRRLRHHGGTFASEAAARNWAANARCCTDFHEVCDLVAQVDGWRAFERRVVAYLDEGLHQLVSPGQALRNAGIALTEVGL